MARIGREVGRPTADQYNLTALLVEALRRLGTPATAAQVATLTGIDRTVAQQLLSTARQKRRYGLVRVEGRRPFRYFVEVRGTE